MAARLVWCATVGLVAGGLSVSGAAASAASATSDAADVRALVIREAALMNRSDWKHLYGVMSPRFRAKCSYPRFVRTQHQSQSILGNQKIHVTDLRVRVANSVAFAAYKVRNAKGQLLFLIDFPQDKYVRVNGRWYDELDKVTGCTQ
jgi:hypothetical protein